MYTIMSRTQFGASLEYVRVHSILGADTVEHGV